MKLSTKNYLQNVIYLTKHNFRVENIIFNYNDELLCVKNCVIEKCFNNVACRNGLPEDYITKQRSSTYQK